MLNTCRLYNGNFSAQTQNRIHRYDSSVYALPAQCTASYWTGKLALWSALEDSNHQSSSNILCNVNAQLQITTFTSELKLKFQLTFTHC